MIQAEGYTNIGVEAVQAMDKAIEENKQYDTIGAEAYGAMDEALMDNRLRNAIGAEAVLAMDAAYAEDHRMDVEASLEVETAAHLARKGAGASNRADRRHHSSGSHKPGAEEATEAPVAPKSAEEIEAERIAQAKAEAATPRRDRQNARAVLHSVVRSVRAEGISPKEDEGGAVDAYVI